MRSAEFFNGLLENDGAGGFTAASPIDATVDAHRCEALDMDGDGRLDLLVQSSSAQGRELVVYPGTAAGFGLAVTVATPPFGMTTYTTVDADGDARMDLALVTATGASTHHVELYRQTAPFVFAAPSVLHVSTLPSFATLDEMESLDVNGDGHDELILRGSYLPQTSMLLSNGSGGYDPLIVLDAEQGSGRVGFVVVDADGDLDVFTGDQGPEAAWWLETVREYGDVYCESLPNSTEQTASMTATGWAFAGWNSLSLTAAQLPSFSSGYFLVSTAPGFAANPGGSEGNLCLGGTIGRYRRPGEVRTSGAEGRFMLRLDLGDVPSSNGTFSVTAGQSLYFQAWYRDTCTAGATSNFTDGVRVDFL